MIVVAGPRIDPESLPSHAGLEVVPYVHNLYRHLAACDLAVVQGGLTTSMELTAQKRPFLYFPLRHHFEQNFHVRHRLERYGAGRRMDFDDSPPERIAAAIAEEIGRDVDYRDVEVDGAARAARAPRRAALAADRASVADDCCCITSAWLKVRVQMPSPLAAFGLESERIGVQQQTPARNEPRASRPALARLLVSPWESSHVGFVASGLSRIVVGVAQRFAVTVTTRLWR